MYESGKRDSNPRPPAWKASALSTELFPHIVLKINQLHWAVVLLLLSWFTL